MTVANIEVQRINLAKAKAKQGQAIDAGTFLQIAKSYEQTILEQKEAIDKIALAANTMANNMGVAMKNIEKITKNEN